MTTFEKIQDLCRREGFEVVHLGERIPGLQLNRGTPSKWKYGAAPRKSTLKAIADHFGVPVSYFDDDPPEELTPKAPSLRSVPRLGQISCGLPLESPENFEGYDEVPDGIDCDYTLTAKGDSMTGARIFDGDLVYIKCTATVENGEIAAVLVDGSETTLKRVRMENDVLTLCPENPAFSTLVFTGREINRVQIIGRVVGVTFKL